jgi:hypothetical protein
MLMIILEPSLPE